MSGVSKKNRAFLVKASPAPPEMICYYCGRGREEVRLLLRHLEVVFCDGCVQIFQQVVNEQLRELDYERLKAFGP